MRMGHLGEKEAPCVVVELWCRGRGPLGRGRGPDCLEVEALGVKVEPPPVVQRWRPPVVEVGARQRGRTRVGSV